MPILYHKIEADNYSDYGVTKNPRFPMGVSFMSGVKITESLSDPLIFEVDNPSQDELPHLLGDTIPIVSDHLLQTLKDCGVDNFQVFPAVLRNPELGVEWKGYWAFNVIGLLAAANLGESEGDTIMEGDPGGVEVPLIGFLNVVLDKDKTCDMSMFRLAESPDIILIHHKIATHIVENRPPNGWGIDLTEVESA